MTEINPLSSRQEHVFLIRVWFEPGQDFPGLWRGFFTQLPGGARLPIRFTSDALRFVSTLQEPVDRTVPQRVLVQFGLMEQDEQNLQSLIVEILPQNQPLLPDDLQGQEQESQS
jgi:hypothetical protein